MATRSASLPPGFRYEAEFLSEAEERELLTRIRALPLAEFRYQAFTAKRRVLSFGYHYSFQDYRITRGEPMPDFLAAVRARAAALLAREPEALAEALLTEYPAGAGIGWHRDVAPFEAIVGVSLGAACTFKLRRGKPGAREIATLTVEPRSAYVLAGPARTEWEHHIPATKAQRYSITFRTLNPAWKAKLEG
jgi:alkylated DNA repair dioxygenase AlkB